MRTLFVTYRGDRSLRFDRDYFVNAHLPLAREIGGPYGLLSIEAFFPAGQETDIVAACQIIFRDEKAVTDVFSAPRVEELLGDRANYTNLLPTQNLLTAL
jgi:uncharacterized protein (TIGR02118 family)